MRATACAIAMPSTRTRAWAVMLLVALAGAACVVPRAQAQAVAPRLTGSMVLDHLGKVSDAAAVRAKATQDAKLEVVVTKLGAMRTALQKSLGDDAGEPTATMGSDARDAVVRADAAAKRVQAWLDASAVACTRDDLDGMLAALTTTLDRLAADTSSQKAPLPVIDGVETLDRRPLFVLRQSKVVPSFVLTGENLVDPQCANPKVVALDAKGQPTAAQPQLVAAQPTRVELRWPDADKLAPGSYTLQLTAERKAFLIGCVSEPPALAALQVAPTPTFHVTYALVATCQGSATPVALDSATLLLSGRDQTASRNVNASACPEPVSYTVTAAVRINDGPAVKTAPVTQAAGASVTAGLGNGLTLSWNPALQQIFVRTGKQGCKGVY